MKFTRRILLFIMVLSICMSMVLTVSAATKSAGIYGVLTSRSYQSGTNIYGETTVTENPDNAYLLVKFTINNNSGATNNYNGTSSKGVTLYTYTKYYTTYSPETIPIYVYYCGEVRGGSQSPSAYVTSTAGYSVDRSQFN